jgi:hypothetical protein
MLKDAAGHAVPPPAVGEHKLMMRVSGSERVLHTDVPGCSGVTDP